MFANSEVSKERALAANADIDKAKAPATGEHAQRAAQRPSKLVPHRSLGVEQGEREYDEPNDAPQPRAASGVRPNDERRVVDHSVVKCGFSIRPTRLPNGSRIVATLIPPPTS